MYERQGKSRCLAQPRVREDLFQEVKLILDIERINSKVLLYSTRNYIQYPVINHNGKEYEK